MKGQGATEYLLILAAVLVVVAVAVYYVTRATPGAMITGTATISSTDNTVLIFTPAATLTPSPIPASDWSWAVYRGATSLGTGSGVGELRPGIPVSIDIGDTALASGDKLKITYKGTAYDAATVA